MAKYEIKIETPANTQGAEKAAKALDKITDASRKVTTETGKLNTETKSAGETQEKTTTSVSKLAAGLKKLGNEIPIIGIALNALKNPWSALAAGAAIAVIKVREFVVAVEKMADMADKLTPFNNTIQTFYTLTEQGKQSDITFAKRLKAIGDAAETNESKLSGMNAAIAKTLGLEAEEDEARKRVALAQVDQQLKTGQIGEGAAAQARGAIESNFAARAADRENRRAAGTVTETFNAKIRAQNAIDAAQQALPGAIAERDEAAKLAETEKLRLKNLQDAGIFFGNKSYTRDEALAERRKLNDELAEPERPLDRTPAGQRTLQKKRDRLTGLETAIQGFDSGLDQQGALLTRATARAGRAAGNVSELQGTIQSNTSAAVGFQRKFGQEVNDTNQSLKTLANVNEQIRIQREIEAKTATLVELQQATLDALKTIKATAARDIQR